MGIKLTKRIVEAAEPAETDQYLWDADVKGFGLKITPTGRKTFLLQYRIAGRSSTTERYTIGLHGSPWTVEKARNEALQLLARVKAGHSPAAERRQERKREPDAPRLVRAIAVQFLERHAKPKNRDWAKTQYILDREVLPAWGDREIAEVTRADVIALLDKIVDRGAPIHANRTLAVVRGLFNWAISRGLIERSPAAGVKAPGDEVARDRVLSEDELRAVWQAASETPYPFGPFLQLLILTAQRRDEVAGLRRSEIDEAAAMWTLPRERAKNDRAHEVPLSPMALEILSAIPRVEGCDLVFSTNGTSPISGFSKAKARLDKASKVGLSEADEWRIHDIRRTVTTHLARMNFPPHVVDKILNHVSGTIGGVAAVYNRHSYVSERRQALDAWANRLQSIVEGGHVSNVVALRA